MAKTVGTVDTVKRENLVKMPEIEAITAINKNYGTGVYTWYYKKFDTVKKAFRYLWNKRKNYKGTTEFIFQIEVDGKMIFNYNSAAKENGLRLMTAEIEKLYNDAEGYSDEEEEEFYYRTNRGTVRKFKIGETNFKAGLAEVSAVESVNVPEDDGSNDDADEEDFVMTLDYNFGEDDELVDEEEILKEEKAALMNSEPVTFELERFNEDEKISGEVATLDTSVSEMPNIDLETKMRDEYVTIEKEIEEVEKYLASLRAKRLEIGEKLIAIHTKTFEDELTAVSKAINYADKNYLSIDKAGMDIVGQNGKTYWIECEWELIRCFINPKGTLEIEFDDEIVAEYEDVSTGRKVLLDFANAIERGDEKFKFSNDVKSKSTAA